jgi:hypothetical protein
MRCLSPVWLLPSESDKWRQAVETYGNEMTPWYQNIPQIIETRKAPQIYREIRQRERKWGYTSRKSNPNLTVTIVTYSVLTSFDDWEIRPLTAYNRSWDEGPPIFSRFKPTSCPLGREQICLGPGFRFLPRPASHVKYRLMIGQQDTSCLD